MLATRKYPDFLEIGLDVWDNIWDWHVVYQQPLNVTRVADGRYAMSFMFTTLLLRPDQNAGFRRLRVRRRLTRSPALSRAIYLALLAGFAAQDREQHQRRFPRRSKL